MQVRVGVYSVTPQTPAPTAPDEPPELEVALALPELEDEVVDVTAPDEDDVPAGPAEEVPLEDEATLEELVPKPASTDPPSTDPPSTTPELPEDELEVPTAEPLELEPADDALADDDELAPDEALVLAVEAAADAELVAVVGAGMQSRPLMHGRVTSQYSPNSPRWQT